MMDFLFISGCPRSGTSALVHLLSGSTDVLLGMERYGHLTTKDNFLLNKSHFEKQRFFKVTEGDTFYDDFDKFHAFDPLIHEKFDNCKIVGDKRPDLYESYDKLFSAFPETKVLFIYRDIIEVASSYQARVILGDTWPKSKNFSQAVNDWNRALFLTREAARKDYNIKTVEFSDIFTHNKDLSPLFSYLNIEYCDNLQKKVKHINARSIQLQKQRKCFLSSKEEQYVAKRAKTSLLNDMAKLNVLN